MKRIAALLLCLFLLLLVPACRQKSIPTRPATVLQLAVQRGISRESAAGLDCFTNKVRELSGGEADTTNNRMELTAVIRALSLLKEPCIVELWSDSKYVIDGLSKGWAKGWKAKGWVKSDKKPALNPDLWDELLRLESIHTLRYHWVKGHAENEFNNRCDELAVAESRKFR